MIAKALLGGSDKHTAIKQISSKWRGFIEQIENDFSDPEDGFGINQKVS